MKRIVTLTILMALTLTAGMALAADPAAGSAWAPWCWRNNVTMTDDQNERLGDIQDRYWERTEAIRDEIADKQDQLDEIYRDDTPNLTRADALEDDIYDLNRELIELRRDYRDEARGVLTDEQLSEYPYAFYGGGPGMGYGYGRGAGMGYGRGSGMGYGMGSNTGFGRGCWRW